MTSFADATKLSMETTVLANATGFRRRTPRHVRPGLRQRARDGELLPAEAMLGGGHRRLRAGRRAAHRRASSSFTRRTRCKQAQLAYYKMGDGPFYVFYTPFHLPHLQIASTIGRAALFGDPTVAPLGGPRCEVVAVAKRDLRAGETLDGIGGFTRLRPDRQRAGGPRGIDALPMGLAEGCVLRRDVAKDASLTAADVRMPAERLSDRLWAEQQQRWPVGSPLDSPLTSGTGGSMKVVLFCGGLGTPPPRLRREHPEADGHRSATGRSCGI